MFPRKFSTLLALAFLFFVLPHTNFAQLNFTHTVPQDVFVCGDEATFVFTFSNATSDNLENLSLNIDLADGLQFVSGSLNIISAPGAYTLSEFDISNLNSVILKPDDLPGLGACQFSFRAKAGCAAIGVVNKFNTFILSGTQFGVNFNLTENSPSFNIQNAVLSITSITPVANTVGINVPYTRTLTLTNGGIGYTKNAVLDINFCGNVLSTNVGTLVGTQISFGATEISAVGDGDAYWELDEAIVLTISLESNSCACNTEVYTVSWGCDGNTCQSNLSTASLAPSNDRPLIGVTLLRGAYPTGACGASDVLTITFTNNAVETVPGAGAALNLDMRFGWDRGTTSGVRNTPEKRTDLVLENFQIQGIPFVPTTGASTFGYQVPASMLNVAHGGLSDVDADGIFDDLPAGASVSFTMTVRNNCLTNCGGEIYRRVLTGWVSTFSEQCSFDNTLSATNNAVFANSNSISATSLAANTSFILVNDRTASINTIPSTIVEGEPTTVTICMDSEMRNLNCPTDELVLLVQKVPGYTLSVAGGNPCVPKNVTIDAVSDPSWFILTPNPVARYDAPNPRTNKRFDDLCLNFNVIMNCSAAGFNPATALNYRFRYVCDNSCACTEFQSCSIINFTNKVCLNCTSGVLNSTFLLRRSTLGWTNETKSTLITPDPCVHRLDRAMSCDIVHLSASGQVIDNGWTGIRYEMSYTSGFQILNYAGNAVLKLTDVSTGSIYNCPLPAPVVSGTSPYKFVFDFSGLIGTCLPPGFTFDAGDLLEIDADVSVIKTASMSSTPTAISNLTGGFIADNGADVACTPLTTAFQVHHPAFNLASSSNAIALTNCGDYFLSIRLEMLSNTGDDFPSEFRDVTHPETISVTLPAGFTFGVGNHIYQLFTPSTSDVIPASAYTISGNTITYNCTAFRNGDKTAGRFQNIRLPIRPTSCDELNQVFSISWTHTAYTYADLACQETQTMNINRNLRREFHELIFSNLPLLEEAYTDAESFTFDLGTPDYATAINAANSWFSLSNPGLTVYKIEDITGPPVNIPVLSAGGGTYWAQVGTINDGTTRRYKVYYRWTTCSDFTVDMRAGWSCFGYPASPLSNDCDNETTASFPIDVKQAVFQGAVNPTAPVGICDFIEYELTLANADLEYIKNLRLNIIYPATGMSYVAGSAKMQYPLSSPFVPIADPVMGMWNLDLLESKFAHGMPGVSVLDSNKIKIRFRLKLDCSFIIGDNPSFVASGIRMCGAPVSTPVIVASPPQIIGAVQPYGTNIQFTGANLQVSECAQSDRMEVRITNQGAGTTSNQDYVFFDLPAGINYMGSYIAGANSPAAPNLTIIPLGGGGTRLSFKLNAGVLPNDFIEFSFLIGTDANLTCGNYNIQTRSVIEQGLYCSTTEEVCNNVTVQTGGSTFVLQVLKPEISYLPSSVDYINLGGGNFQLALYGSINNTSTVDSHAAGSNSLTIKFYCDYGTAPGIVDSDDNLFATYTTTANIPAGGTILLAGATCAEIFTITDCNKLFNIVWVIEQNSQIGTPQQQCLCEAYGGEIIHEDILPINWFNISAKAKGENNEIRWKVLENPLNLRYVVLNETANGEWTGIGEIAAKKVFAQETVEYFFTHKNPKNFEKYRLKSLDADGKETFSKEVNLRRSDKNEEIFVYPNPTSSLLNVLINEDAEVQISDLLGKEILKTTVKAEGENALNVAHLPAGTYIIRFLTATGLKAVKFSKE